MKSPGKFNIRVYGIYINEQRQVLVCDEERFGIRMTKFPGGGLQFGEGTIDCLKREAMEEFGQNIEIVRHFYTTDFYQEAFFYENQQLLSIYYLIDFLENIRFDIADKAFAFDPNDEEPISFRIIPLETLQKNDLTFPVDQYVLGLLKEIA